MSEHLESLESLVKLAKEHSSDKRHELLRVVANMFLEKPDELSQSEVDHFADIMGKIAFDLEMEVRKDLAERLSTIDTVPAKLMNMLANDEIEVARPVLKQCGVLAKSDLIEIIKRHSQEHLMAISVRKILCEEVSHHLVQKGDDSVLESLVRNKGARLSRESLEILTEKSEQYEPLQEPLIMRDDMPPDLKHEMFIYVSSALREHILATIEDIDESEIDRLLEQTRAKLDAPETEVKQTPAEKFITRKEHLKLLKPDLLMQLLRQGKIAEFVAGLGRLANLDTETAHRITFDEGGETLAVACKAIGIDRITFSDLLLLTNQEGGRTQADRDSLLGVYSRITTEAAKKVIRFWRARKRMSHI